MIYDGTGDVMAVFYVDDWAPAVPGHAMPAQDAFDASGLKHLMHAAGITVRTIGGRRGTELLNEIRSHDRYRPWREGTIRLILARVVALLPSGVGLLMMKAADDSPGVVRGAVIAASGALLAAILDGSIVGWLVWRDRATRCGDLVWRPVGTALLYPTFWKRSAVLCTGDDVVLRNGSTGSELWLPRKGRGAVTELSVLGRPGEGDVTLAFRTGTGRAAALLPWSHWFAEEPHGSAQVRYLADRLRLPINGPSASSRRPMGDSGNVLMGSQGAAPEVMSGWLIGPLSPQPIIAFGGLALLANAGTLWQFGGEGPLIGLLMAALACAVSAGRLLVRALLRRYVWKPIAINVREPHGRMGEGCGPMGLSGGWAT